jgi:hypothetical protein
VEKRKKLVKIPFDSLPEEIQEAMLKEQVRQGNERNADIFNNLINTDNFEGGMNWGSTKEGSAFWYSILFQGHIYKFFEKYPSKITENDKI